MQHSIKTLLVSSSFYLLYTHPSNKQTQTHFPHPHSSLPPHPRLLPPPSPNELISDSLSGLRPFLGLSVLRWEAASVVLVLSPASQLVLLQVSQLDLQTLQWLQTCWDDVLQDRQPASKSVENVTEVETLTARRESFYFNYPCIHG